jgi:hypothetical protein
MPTDQKKELSFSYSPPPPNQIGRQGFGAQVVIQQVYEIQENI